MLTGFAKKKNIHFTGVLGLSILLHSAFLLLIGGIVLIEGIRPHADFGIAALPGDLPGDEEQEMPEEEGASGLDNPQELPSPPESVAEPSKETDPASMAILTSDSPSPLMFPAALPNASVSFLANGTASGQGTGQGAGKGSGGRGLRGMGSLFGSKNAAEGGFAGYLYDLKQEPDGKPTSMMGQPGEGTSESLPVNVDARRVVEKFIRNWDPAVLKHFYRAPDPLYAQQFFIPNDNADKAPKAFGVEKQVQPKRWLIHYKGTVSAPRSGTFRFVGLGDDVLIVRFDGKDVLDASWTLYEKSFNERETYEKPFASSSRELRIGKWFTVTQGQSYPMELLMGETLGGVFCNFLLVEEKDVSYPARTTAGQSPRLPVFQASPTVIPEYRAEENAPGVMGEGLVFSDQ